MPDGNTLLQFGIAAMNLIGLVILFQTKKIASTATAIAVDTKAIAQVTQAIAQKTELNTNSIVSKLVQATQTVAHAEGVREQQKIEAAVDEALAGVAESPAKP